MTPSKSFHLLPACPPSRYQIPVLACRIGDTYIIRTLDPEYSHQISFARILYAANIPIVEGLVKYKLVPGLDFCTDLGVSGPSLTEIWMNVGKARSLIAQLWARPESALVQLTSPVLDRCWSLYDRTRSSLLHNWTISSIPAAAYSTAVLVDTVFSIDQIRQATEKSQWTRTGIPQATDTQHDQDQIDVALIKWSASAAERYFSEGEMSQRLPDWLFVVKTLEELSGVTNRMSDSAGLNDQEMNKRFEVTIAASYERILRKSRNTHRRSKRFGSGVSRKSMSVASTQTSTDVEQMDNTHQRHETYKMVNKACQTDTIERNPRMQRSIVIPLVAITLAYVYWSTF